MRPIFIIASGQSNMMGHQEGTGGSFAINHDVLAWDGTSWCVATPGQAPFPVTIPARNNPAWQFCKRLQKETDRTVYLVLSGRGATAISAWAAPSGAQWIDLDTAARAALASPELSGTHTSPDYFLWLQGENDPINTDYEADFLALRSAAISSGWMTPQTPVIAGEIIADNAAKLGLLNLLQDRTATWFNLARNENAEISGSGPHFTGIGYDYLGQLAFYEAAKNIPRYANTHYSEWTPVLKASNDPTCTYDATDNIGGLYRLGNLVFAWFTLKLLSKSGGAGPPYIGGLPVLPSATIPANGGSRFTSVAGPTSGLNLASSSPLFLRANPGSGIYLLRNDANGNSVSLPLSEIGATAKISGSVMFMVD